MVFGDRGGWVEGCGGGGGGTWQTVSLEWQMPCLCGTFHAPSGDTLRFMGNVRSRSIPSL